MEIKSVPGNSFVEHFSFSSIIILGIYYYCYVFFGQFFRIPSIILLFLGVFIIIIFFLPLVIFFRRIATVQAKSTIEMLTRYKMFVSLNRIKGAHSKLALRSPRVYRFSRPNNDRLIVTTPRVSSVIQFSVKLRLVNYFQGIV